MSPSQITRLRPMARIANTTTGPQAVSATGCPAARRSKTRPMRIPKRSGEPWTSVHTIRQNRNRTGRYLTNSQRIRNVPTRPAVMICPLPGARASRSSLSRPPAGANSGCPDPRARSCLGPCSATCPDSTTMISSAVRTVSSRWATMTTVRPEKRRSVATASNASVAGSSRDEGSSRITTPGSWRKTRAKASSCCSPADRPLSPRSELGVEADRADPASQAGPIEDAAGSPRRDVSPKRVRLSRTGGPEELDILSHHPEATPQRIEARRPQIDLADPHGPGVGVVETRDQPCDRGLAAAGAPQQPEHRARLEAKARRRRGRPGPRRRT